MKAIYVFLIFLTLACGKSESNPRKENDGFKLKVMTYNIHHGNPPNVAALIDIKAIAKVIKDQAPDIVGLQEVDVFTERSGKESNQAKDIAELVGMNYYFAKAIDYQGGEYGVAILSKYPISNTEALTLPKKEGVSGEQRVIAIAELTLPNEKKIVFASTHFDTEPHRDIQAQFVLDQLKKYKDQVLLVGDFNAEMGSRSMSILANYFTPTCPKSCTRTVLDHPTKAIDHIFYSPNFGLSLESHQVIQEKYASDHMPVIAIYK